MIAELRQELSVSRQEVTDLKTMHAQELESTKTTQHREVCYSKIAQVCMLQYKILSIDSGG